jgi:4-hydroxybenzoyl-CoA thioesterase
MPSLVNRLPKRVAWGDCDPAQIVFYPRYFAMFDEATQELFHAALGMPKIKWVKKFGIIGIPMVDTRAKFAIPSFYGDDIVIETRVLAFRRSSFDVEHKILKGDRVAVEGFETRVWSGPDPDRPGGIKSVAIPDEVLKAFERTS